MPITRLAALLALVLLAGGCALMPAGQSAQNDADSVENEVVPAAAAEDVAADKADLTATPDSDAADATAVATAATDDAGTSDDTPSAPPAKPATLWDHIRDGYAIPPQGKHPRIGRELSWYADNQAYLNRVVARAQPYAYYIVQELQQRDMPLEIALLPIVESAYDPFAYSHGRASGLWQFIPGTGRHYDLKQDWWYDGRRDVAASTRAALDYLEDLHSRFGDWLLALAAYNCGAGNVSRAIRYNRRRDRPTDFWHLNLPRETSTYVPKLLALKRLFREPDTYGIDIPEIANQPYLARVPLKSQIDLALAADIADMPLQELYLLNPGFNRWATAPDGPYALFVPKDKADTLKDGLSKLPKSKRVHWSRHRIRSGDSLLSIAHRYHTTVGVLREVNGVHGNIIRAGDYLMVPTATRKLDRYVLSQAQRLAKTQSVSHGGNKVEHVVQSGESFWSIARHYDVSVRKLAGWNGMAPGDTLHAGRKLVVWTRHGSASASAHRASLSPINTVRTVWYTVRRGDSLAEIAQRFGVTVHKLANWNSLDLSDYLQPGQKLKMLVDVTRTSTRG